MVMVRLGNWKPELVTAGLTRSCDSLTAPAGEPDRLEDGLSAVTDMDLDLDAERIDAVQCGREYTCYQGV